MDRAHTYLSSNLNEFLNGRGAFASTAVLYRNSGTGCRLENGVKPSEPDDTRQKRRYAKGHHET